MSVKIGKKEKRIIQSWFLIMMDQLNENEPQDVYELQHYLGSISVMLSYYEAYENCFDVKTKQAINYYLKQITEEGGIKINHKIKCLGPIQ